jgi:hypothetical protein
MGLLVAKANEQLAQGSTVLNRNQLALLALSTNALPLNMPELNIGECCRSLA